MPTKTTRSTASSPKRTAARAALEDQRMRRGDTLKRLDYQTANVLTRKNAEPGRYSKKMDQAGVYEKEYRKTLADGLAQKAYYRATGEYPTVAQAKARYGKKK